jgi:hypothetical protein
MIKIRNIIREALEDEEIPGFGRDYSEKKIPSEKEIEKVLKDWYHLGQATWKSRGAPGEDGEWGGTFHYLGSLQHQVGGNLSVYVDMGSCEEDDEAMHALDHMLRSIGAKIDYYTGHQDSRKIYIKIGEEE